MRSLPFSISLTGPALFFLLVAQNPRPLEPQPPKPRKTPEVRVTPPEGALKEIARTTEAMQGLWILKELKWPHLDGINSEFRGYCLVSDNHLSFEVHIGLRDEDRKLRSVMLDSGIWRFEVGEANRAFMTTVIGSFIDKDDRVAFRESGTQARYDVEAMGNVMVWSKEDGQKLTFEHILDDGPARVDVYGRSLPEKKDTPPKDPEPKKEPRKDG